MRFLCVYLLVCVSAKYLANKLRVINCRTGPSLASVRISAKRHLISCLRWVAVCLSVSEDFVSDASPPYPICLNDAHSAAAAKPQAAASLASHPVDCMLWHSQIAIATAIAIAMHAYSKLSDDSTPNASHLLFNIIASQLLQTDHHLVSWPSVKGAWLIRYAMFGQSALCIYIITYRPSWPFTFQ